MVAFRALIGQACAAFLLLSGCAQPEVPQIVADTVPPMAPVLIPPAGHRPEPPQTVASAAINTDVLRVGYRQIADLYLTRVDFASATMDGLSNLRTVDDRLSVRPVGSSIELGLGGATVARFDAPDPSDPTAWADLTSAALTAAAGRSQLVAAAGPEALYDAVFTGITRNLDPYSRYTPPDQAQRERASREGYSGIGIALSEDQEGRLIVGEVFPDGPADQAGVRVGERILAVDGAPTEGRALESIAEALRGNANTLVSMTLGAADGTERTVVLRRERVVPNAVTTNVRDGVIIVRISRFNATTSANVANSILSAMRSLGPSARGIVLDMRGNPGGYLQQSVDVADLFIDRGEIASTRGRNPASMQFYYSDPFDIASHLPVVVLLDQHSASGAEVTAAALMDSGRAVVVGSSSFGKGSVQKITMLPNGGDLYLTWSRLYTPAGYTLHRQGVTPTICTSASGESPDVESLLAAFQAGTLAHAPNLLEDRMLAPDDEAALRRLRDACPWATHEPEIDVEVAIRLIGDPGLYAMGIAQQGVVLSTADLPIVPTVN